MSDNLLQIPLQNLQFSDELGFVDAIDKLRSHGISHYVSLPQLVVCGDQSSGKSSVLDAISGIPFPTKDNLCTRFATELILRRTSTATVSVSIVPCQDRSKSECEQLSQFRESLSGFNDVPILIEKAKEAMGLSAAAAAFSNDVLRIEISGPDRPHLTIVDLPGLIHSENKIQKAADVELVQRLVHSYMSNPRSIILAVVSAKNDYANQVVLKHAREVDPDGTRTLGVITKPDTLPVGSESEAAYLALARNEDVYFRLGWHVLKNRDYEARHCSAQERDLAEEQFFSCGVWNNLPSDLVGIATLRHRLSNVLLEHIRKELPSLGAEIEDCIQDCDAKLCLLGESRSTLDEQRLYLLHISQSFHSVVKAAKDGAYGESIFGDPRTSGGYCKRLRAVIQNLSLEFAENMRINGGYRKIIEDSVVIRDTATASQTHLDGEITETQVVTKTEYVNEIREILKRSRGRELPGMFNPLIVGDLFYEQSRPWKEISQIHINAVWKSAVTFLNLLLSELADKDTAEALQREVVLPAMNDILRRMRRKLDKILVPFQKGHPITYNHYFTETIQNVREKRLESEMRRRLSRFFGASNSTSIEELHIKKVKISGLIGALSTRNEADMDKYACSEVLDCMEAYYKVAMKVFVDNVSVQCVEGKLVTMLDDILSPSCIIQMDAALIEKVAAESSQSRGQRAKLLRTLAALQAGAKVCNRFVGQRSIETLQHHQWPISKCQDEEKDLPTVEVDVDDDIVLEPDASDNAVLEPTLPTAMVNASNGEPSGLSTLNFGLFSDNAIPSVFQATATAPSSTKKSKKKKGKKSSQQKQ